MSGTIYLVHDKNQLVEMNESPYSSEDLLQTLLADYPNLLAGDQMDSDDPRRWLLVRREMSLPSTEGGGGRWSVDHLFLDQDGIPTIIEVKRGTDTRIRREVVGQMLEYAANAVVYWPAETMQAQFEANCGSRSSDPDQVLEDFLEGSMESDAFWQAVRTNLQAGKVRLVFVADVIPSELRRVVEFLNVQMSPAEVLAVEIRQYVGQGQQALVPRVIGQTEQALQKKSGGTRERRDWDDTTFFTSLEQKHGESAARVAREIMDWAKSRSLTISWGKGKVDGSFTPVFMHNSQRHWTFAVWTYGSAMIEFRYICTRAPFDDTQKRMELLERINDIKGVSIPEDRISGIPHITLNEMSDPAVLQPFLAAFDWLIAETRKI